MTRSATGAAGSWPPPAASRIASTAVVNDAGLPDPVLPSARQHAVQDLPDDAMVFLLGSRYCETDRLSDTAWALFGQTPMGWGRVQAICDFVHNHIVFDYMAARSTKTAWEVFRRSAGCAATTPIWRWRSPVR